MRLTLALSFVRPGPGPMRGFAALLLSCIACGAPRAGPQPNPAVGSSTDGQRAFVDARDAFLDHNRGRAEVRLVLERFLEKYDTDGLAPLAHAYTAHVALDLGDTQTAKKHVGPLVDPKSGQARAPGVVGDLAQLAMGRLWRREGSADRAYPLLRELVGKLLDPWARVVLDREVTMAALESGAIYEAFTYMDAWLREVPEEEREGIRETLRKLLVNLPRGSVENVFRAMNAGESTGYGPEVRRLVAQRLAAIATADNDARLARTLLDLDASGRLLSPELTLALQDVAAAKRGQLAVAGRSIGIVLPTSQPQTRDAAADVVRGAAYALGLPRVDPTTSDGIALITKSDAGASRIALEELAGEGAAVIIAGVDTQGADEALTFAERRQVPVITLATPSVPTGKWGFVLGESEVRQLDVLEAELHARKIARSGLVLEGLPPAVALARASFAPPAGCDVREGDLRAQWTWTVIASENCGRRVLDGLARSRALVALGLRAMTDRLPSGVSALGVAAGRFPAQSEDAEIAAYSQRFGGKPTWWVVVGRDAAALSRAAVRALPVDTTQSPEEVLARREQALRALESAAVDLWSTEARGFSDHVVKRTLKVVPLR